MKNAATLRRVRITNLALVLAVAMLAVACNRGSTTAAKTASSNPSATLTVGFTEDQYVLSGPEASLGEYPLHLAREGVSGGLRLGVLGGGCSGLSYQFKFDARERPTDKVFEYDGVKIFVDPKSLLYLHGMTLDYQESLMQSGFVFDNPNAKKACGCGTSFSS